MVPLQDRGTSFAPARRGFLCAAGSALLTAASSVVAQTPIQRTGRAKFTPALNAYSFLEPLTANRSDPAKGIDLFGVCDFCAEHDIEAIDVTGYFFPGYPQSPPDEYISRMKRHVHDRGIVISGTGVKNDFVNADEAVRSEGVRLTKEWIGVAARLGAPVVRVFAGPTGAIRDWREAAGCANRDEVEQRVAEHLHECAEHGEKSGVLVAVQNHGDFISTAPEHLALLKRVDHPWCGALIDTGKYLTADPYADIEMMVPHAVNWQIKETLGSSLESPPTDFRKLARIIRDGGYRGFVPIETLSMGRMDYDPAAEVVKVLAAMRTAIAGL